MILGFTGTQEGMTGPQKDALIETLEALKVDEAHQGCCVGADAEFVVLVSLDMGDRGVKIHAHPSTLRNKTDWESLRLSDVVHPKKSPLLRNRDIVDPSGLLIACPKEVEEQVRSGTWATVRYARKQGKSVRIIFPDGTVEEG